MDSAEANREMQPSPARHCWECQRRRLVCDAARPVCKKCVATGVVCPGYDDKKPLRWVTPGKVTSRTREKKKAVPPVRISATPDDGAGLSHGTHDETDSDHQQIECTKNKIIGPSLIDLEWGTEVSDIVQAACYCKPPFPFMAFKFPMGDCWRGHLRLRIEKGKKARCLGRLPDPDRPPCLLTPQ